ncbi:MAG: type I restriction enzyme HsdR N-terminal domain-containing protein [Prolixibacteraceae bacterium]|nr:type I restriction enzyme HsdR N-terminal domain-containing protein [Prolixibacteraceae bacterium]
MPIKLPKLNFPDADLRFKEISSRIYVFDESRKKYVVLTPEEWVRQRCLHYLSNHKNYPGSLLTVEKGIRVNNREFRYDIVAYSKAAKPLLLVECKAPEVKIDQKVFDQIAVYNFELKVPYLLVTNGLSHYCCKVNFDSRNYNFLREVPDYSEVI